MSVKTHIDFDYVPDNQLQIHAMLVNWARWVKVRPHGCAVHPMFRQAQSNARQWHPPEIQTPVNTIQADEVEKAISAMPHKHKTALRWAYVWRDSPVKVAKSLAVNKEMLFDLLIDGRNMLKNTCEAV